MPQIDVKYQHTNKNQSVWISGNTSMNTPDCSRSAIKNLLLARNPNWDDVRIIEIRKR